VVTVLNPGYWSTNVPQLAKVLRSPSGPPKRIPDPSGVASESLTIHDPAYWGAHVVELDSALRRATGAAATPARDSGVGTAPVGVERLTLTVEEAATMLGIDRNTLRKKMQLLRIKG